MSVLHSCGVRHIDLGGSPGRCPECSFHVETQGHRDCCSGTAPVQPPSPYTGNFLENSRRLKAERRGESEKPTRRNTTAIAQAGTNPAYVAAALRGELEGLAAAVEGCRNDKLNRAAFAVFGFVKGGHADEESARAELERIASTIGLPHSEIQATLRSAWTSAVPRGVPA